MSRSPWPAVLLAGFAFGANVGAEEAIGGHAFPPPSPELLVHPARAERPEGIHPPIVLLDGAGKPVLESGAVVSFTRTCGTCHDASWIGHHGYHFRVGVDEQTATGRAGSGRPWDFGPGLFGRWDPLAGYDSVLGPAERQGAAVDHWISQNHARLAGGGPARLGEQARDFEPNCALCHVRGARFAGDSRIPLAAHATAALQPLGLVEVAFGATSPVTVSWNREAFSSDGTVDATRFRIQSPSDESCGQCHGIAAQHAPKLADWGSDARQTETTGQLFVATRISDSTLNLQRRDQLARPWDVHAERLVSCADCHFSPNDPTSAFRSRDAQPEHLRHEVRNLPLGEFLRRPNHDLAKGFSTQGQIANALDGSMRRCEDCHDALRVHRWLPKAERHLDQVGCETCHVDSLHAPSRRVTDYSVIDSDGNPRLEYRGLSGVMSDPAAYLPEYRPLLLRRKEPNGKYRLLPYNMVTTFYWTIEASSGVRPASIALLKLAFYEKSGAASKLTALLDRNRDGRIEDGERVLTTQDDVTAARALLMAAGAKNPQLVGEMQPYGIHHGMAPARFALRDCNSCHSGRSRLATVYSIADQAPFGVTPKLIGDTNIVPAFTLERSSATSLSLVPNTSAIGLHVFGLTRIRWLDGLGFAGVGLVLAGALGHGALRFISSRRRRGKAS